MPDQSLKVLHGGGEEKFVTRTGKATQSEPVDAEDVLHLAEQRLDLFAFTSRDRVGLALHHCARVITRRFIDVSVDPALPARS